jgi:hypothetical protein
MVAQSNKKIYSSFVQCNKASEAPTAIEFAYNRGYILVRIGKIVEVDENHKEVGIPIVYKYWGKTIEEE